MLGFGLFADLLLVVIDGVRLCFSCLFRCFGIVCYSWLTCVFVCLIVSLGCLIVFVCFCVFVCL